MFALLAAVLPAGRVLQPDAAHRIAGGGLYFEPGFMPSRLVSDLRQDVSACAAAGLFESAGSGGRAGEVDTMRSAVYCDPVARDRDLGIWDAFVALWERLDMAREELAEGLGVTLLPEMELHYVRYPARGFYQRHVDDHVEPGDRPSRRCVSFICYLTEAEPAWSAADGGQLRVHPGTDGPAEEYLPESGSLALFDSTALEHEVMPTRRERTCLIGWFHTPL